MTGPLVRLTVTGPHGAADLAVPADVPVTDYLPDLLVACGEPATLNSGWQLAVPGCVPLPASDSLGRHQVLDGAILHLYPGGGAAHRAADQPTSHVLELGTWSATHLTGLRGQHTHAAALLLLAGGAAVLPAGQAPAAVTAVVAVLLTAATGFAHRRHSSGPAATSALAVTGGLGALAYWAAAGAQTVSYLTDMPAVATVGAAFGLGIGLAVGWLISALPVHAAAALLPPLRRPRSTDIAALLGGSILGAGLGVAGLRGPTGVEVVVAAASFAALACCLTVRNPTLGWAAGIGAAAGLAGLAVHLARHHPPAASLLLAAALALLAGILVHPQPGRAARPAAGGSRQPKPPPPPLARPLR